MKKTEKIPLERGDLFIYKTGGPNSTNTAVAEVLRLFHSTVYSVSESPLSIHRSRIIKKLNPKDDPEYFL